ncbi:unnamed protein product [Closterium sp. Yama58-4]|nr:unnamed protein product [Closterium sp. Yama58-4]
MIAVLRRLIAIIANLPEQIAINAILLGQIVIAILHVQNASEILHVQNASEILHVQIARICARSVRIETRRVTIVALILQIVA